MKTPKFWKTETILSRLLAPVGWVYYAISYVHRKIQGCCAKPEKLSAPIICIGNATAGGAGKTPTVRMLCTMLKISGQEPHCVSRSYSGKKQIAPLRIDVKQHKAEQVGDEPLLLAQTSPSWIGNNRQDVAKAAIKCGASVILFDDGLQNPKFHKDISILVMDSHYGIGNGHIIPVGPLREPISHALKRADAVIMIGDGKYKPTTDLPIWNAKLEITNDLSEYKNQSVIAFSGLGNNDKFFASLRSNGIEPIEEISYGDHHHYSTNDIALLLDKAEEKQASLLTTAKDYVKLPETFRDNCIVVDVKLQLEQPKEFLHWLEQKIANG